MTRKMPQLQRHPFGFLEVINKPTPQELSDYYANTYFQDERSNYRKSYPDAELAFIRAKVAQRVAITDALRPGKGVGSMLDVGCGEGHTLKHFHGLGWQVDGMDFSVTGAEQMNPDIAHLIQPGDVFESLQERINAGKKYDLIWLVNVLEHVIDPLGLLESVSRILPEDGILIVTVPNDGSAYQFMLEEDGHISYPFWQVLPDHLSYFNKDSLRSTADATGWVVEDMIGDFPVDLYLAHPGSNYVEDKAQGAAAHAARVKLEHLIDGHGIETANAFFRALADVGLGRNLTAFLSRKPT